MLEGVQQQNKVVEGLLDLIEQERRGESVPRSLLTHLVHMFISLGTFAEVVQAPFLAQTRSFYEAEGKLLVDKEQPAAYLVHCEVISGSTPRLRCYSSIVIFHTSFLPFLFLPLGFPAIFPIFCISLLPHFL